jgi:NAD(P)-dependent dehydrogenase (short-subunit alcohol dehydrogenase family)
MIPLKRLGQPEDITPRRQCSGQQRRSAYITGQILTVDGGLSLGE